MASRPSKIEQAGKEDEVRRLAAQGKSTREISKALSKQGLQVTHGLVARFLKTETEERRVAARHVAAEQAKETVPLATNAVRQVLVMNLGLAQKLYQAAASDKLEDRRTTPASASLPITKYSAVVVAASKTLHQMTIGDGADDDQLKKLNQRVREIMRSKQNAGPDAPEPPAAPAPPRSFN